MRIRGSGKAQMTIDTVGSEAGGHGKNRDT